MGQVKLAQTEAAEPTVPCQAGAVRVPSPHDWATPRECRLLASSDNLLDRRTLPGTGLHAQFPRPECGVTPGPAQSTKNGQEAAVQATAANVIAAPATLHRATGPSEKAAQSSDRAPQRGSETFLVCWLEHRLRFRGGTPPSARVRAGGIPRSPYWDAGETAAPSRECWVAAVPARGRRSKCRAQPASPTVRGSRPRCGGQTRIAWPQHINPILRLGRQRLAAKLVERPSRIIAAFPAPAV